MRYAVACMTCLGEHFEAAVRDPQFVPESVPAFIDNSGLVHVTCSKDHESLVIVQLPKYEILFESGLSALADGYPSEAVSSFAAALERTFEFCVQVICTARGIPPSEFEKAWKAITNHSERQLGAFLFLHLLDTGEPFALPPDIDFKSLDELQRFRNRVLHRGDIPTSREVESYAAAVFLTIRASLIRLRAKHDQTVSDIFTEIIASRFRRAPPRARVVILGRVRIDSDGMESLENFRQKLTTSRMWLSEPLRS